MYSLKDHASIHVTEAMLANASSIRPLILQLQRTDITPWLFLNGDLKVKFSYHFVRGGKLGESHSCGTNQMSEGWKAIWRIDVPLKNRAFCL